MHLKRLLWRCPTWTGPREWFVVVLGAHSGGGGDSDGDDVGFQCWPNVSVVTLE